jgi:ComF family protein
MVSERAADSFEVLCGPCRTSEPAFDRARSYGIYRGALRHLILELKFHRRERLARRLGGFLAHTWKTLEGFANGEPFLIVPVPLFHVRERERGFNQARLLAEGLRRQLGMMQGGPAAKIETTLLARTRATRPQTRLKFQQRMENVRGAFAVAKPGQALGRQIVLVDDVMTTGATLSACASALKKSGAARVYALTVARATPQFPDTDDRSGSAGVDEFGSHWR